MPSLSIIITADTRPGWLNDKTYIGEHGNVNLCGCKSVDFLTHATVARNRFLESPLVTERETILCVDVHELIPKEVLRELEALKASGELTAIHYRTQDHGVHRWNDQIYNLALRHATGDLVAKWDGDTIGYRDEGFDFVAMAMEHLDNGMAYVCQQSQLTPEQHGMTHASTRFFLTRRETMDLDEAERCLDDRYRVQKFPQQHLPCIEHILGALVDGRVIYPMADYDNYLSWSWVTYFNGTIQRLNNMTYDEVKEYVLTKCGGPMGAEDLIGVPV